MQDYPRNSQDKVIISIGKSVIPASVQGSKKTTTHVDFSNPGRGNTLSHGGSFTYVISPLDMSDKFSTGYGNCTFVAGFGKDILTSERVSFLTHQNPKVFLGKCKRDFLDKLKERLEEFLQRTSPESREVHIGGGSYADKHHIIRRLDYRASIKLLSSTVAEHLGQDPYIVIGPNLGVGFTDVYLATSISGIYINRNSSPYEVQNQGGTSDELLRRFPLNIEGILTLRLGGIQQKMRELLE